jgi:hypothetical protein
MTKRRHPYVAEEQPPLGIAVIEEAFRALVLELTQCPCRVQSRGGGRLLPTCAEREFGRPK